MGVKRGGGGRKREGWVGRENQVRKEVALKEREREISKGGIERESELSNCILHGER